MEISDKLNLKKKDAHNSILNKLKKKYRNRNHTKIKIKIKRYIYLSIYIYIKKNGVSNPLSLVGVPISQSKFFNFFFKKKH